MPLNPSAGAAGFPGAIPRSIYLAPAAGFLYFLIRYRSPAYGAGGAMVLIAFHLFLQGRFRGPHRDGLPLGKAALILAAVALPALGAWQFLQLRDLGDMDQASYSAGLWNIRHGNFRYSIDGNNMFGIHSAYTALLWIPLHWLGGELGIKMGQGACLIAASLLAVRDLRTPRDAAAWGALAILLAPQVASQFFFGFHPEILAAPVLVLALRAYRKENLAFFLFCTAFLAYSKEVFTLAVGGILLVALAERRSWKWILLPGLLCCAQMAVYWFLVMPRFAPEGNLLSFFMPTSPAQILDSWLRPRNLFYLLHASLPFLPLMRVFPKRYLLLPLPLMAFYAAFPDPLFTVMWPNYAFPTAFLCAAGLVLDPDRLAARPQDGRILAACAVLSLLSYPLWREAFSIPMGNLERAREVDRLSASIPLDAPVVVNGPLLARFAARAEMASWGYRKKPLAHFEYAVIDTVVPFWQFTSGQRARSADSLAADPAWTVQYAEKGLYVFRRKDAAP
ncbi:MAG TPA: DUF2079 domain-containing protein [Fibrobacteria bacterium]|nr:DUF2079 domain-containing protein [Fibrobacteria bacterium]